MHIFPNIHLLGKKNEGMTNIANPQIWFGHKDTITAQIAENLTRYMNCEKITLNLIELGKNFVKLCKI